MTLPINAELAGAIALLVVSIVGALKKALPGLRSRYTVAVTALLSLGIAIAHTACMEGDTSAAGIFRGAMTGLAAWVAAWVGANAARWKAKENGG